MFMIVAEGDAPIYEAEFVNAQRVRARCHILLLRPRARDAMTFTTLTNRFTAQREDNSHLNQFIIHAALDMVDDSVWGTQSMTFKSVDKFNDFIISAFVTAGHIKLMLLHDVRNDEGIRNFFNDVHELYVKVLMNAFYQPNSAITSTLFDSRVKTLGRRYF